MSGCQARLFPSPLDVDRELYTQKELGIDKGNFLWFPASHEVDRWLYGPLARIRGQ